jgi:hypothetical protein
VAIASEEDYDLWIGDEARELDYSAYLLRGAIWAAVIVLTRLRPPLAW